MHIIPRPRSTLPLPRQGEQGVKLEKLDANNGIQWRRFGSKSEEGRNNKMTEFCLVILFLFSDDYFDDCHLNLGRGFRRNGSLL